jgi:pyruvate dehydrogenase complex dehydrogenase (E1) component
MLAQAERVAVVRRELLHAQPARDLEPLARAPAELGVARELPAPVIAVEARRRLQADGISTAVVSMPSWELFELQDPAYRAATLGQGCVRVGVEAAVRFGWDRYLGESGAFVGMTGFGASGPADALYEHFGITPAAIVAAARRRLRSSP